MPETEFWQLLREAQHASEAVDNFDLRSKSEASRQAFTDLVRVQSRSAIELIDFVVTNYAAIRKMLDDVQPFLIATAKPTDT